MQLFEQFSWTYMGSIGIVLLFVISAHLRLQKVRWKRNKMLLTLCKIWWKLKLPQKTPREERAQHKDSRNCYFHTVNLPDMLLRQFNKSEILHIDYLKFHLEKKNWITLFQQKFFHTMCIIFNVCWFWWNQALKMVHIVMKSFCWIREFNYVSE